MAFIRVSVNRWFGGRSSLAVRATLLGEAFKLLGAALTPASRRIG